MPADSNMYLNISEMHLSQLLVVGKNLAGLGHVKHISLKNIVV